MLSLKKGIPVCEIIDTKGKNKPKKIFINADDEDEDENSSFPILERDQIIPKSFFTELRGINGSNMLLLKAAIRDNKTDLIEKKIPLMDAFKKASAILKELEGKHYIHPKGKGKLEVIPSHESSRIFVAGASGAGKSTWIGNFLKQYKSKYKKNKIYIFSPVLDDEAFASVKPEYIKLDESVVEEPLQLEEFSNSCLVFDDVESISDKYILEAVRKFADMCLEAGRHENITTIIVSHILLNGNFTKRALNECCVCIFPKSNFAQVQNLCRRYYGFTKNEFDYMKNLKSRWVYIHKTYPITMISEHEIKIV